MSHRPTLRSLEDARATSPLYAFVAPVVQDELPIALELVGLVRSGRVAELTREGRGGRYTLNTRGVFFTRAGEAILRSTSLDEWERCVRECWVWARRLAAR